ncbi:HNH endonuclease [Gordonia terrae]|uniref:HNH endonuclease n=1 Tax=Gordonia terrae TaxID=2055 RepID=UPI003B8A762F
MTWQKGWTSERTPGRAVRIVRARRWCASCGQPGKFVDHIIPRAEGGRGDLSNLQLLCASCHDAKTLRERLRGQRRRAARGKCEREPHPAYLDPEDTHDHDHRCRTPRRSAH